MKWGVKVAVNNDWELWKAVEAHSQTKIWNSESLWMQWLDKDFEKRDSEKENVHEL